MSFRASPGAAARDARPSRVATVASAAAPAFLGGTVTPLAHLVELGLDLRHSLHLHLELRVDALDLF